MNNRFELRYWMGLAIGANLLMWVLLGVISAASGTASTPVTDILLLTLIIRGLPGALITVVCIALIYFVASALKSTAIRWPYALVMSLLISGLIRWTLTGWDLDQGSLLEVLFTCGIDGLSATVGLLLSNQVNNSKRQ